MNIRLVSLFPEFFDGPLSCGLMSRAVKAGILEFSFHNPRDYAKDKHRSVDDRPYGGGPGMVLLPTPLASLLDHLGFSDNKKNGRLIFLSPRGKPLTQALAKELALEESLTFVCGRYEGIDARIETAYEMESVCVGEAVLNGGEAAAVCLIESVARLLPGFMGHNDSSKDESFSHGLLEYPHFTRPETFAGISVPHVLTSGDHKAIAQWRKHAMLETTLYRRPELLNDASLTAIDRLFLQTLPLDYRGRNLYCALVHHPVLDKEKKSCAVSLTNLDVHDIARCSCTYGLGKFFMVTPLQDQQQLLTNILHHWTKGAGSKTNPDRKKALNLVEGLPCIAEAINKVKSLSGQRPIVLGTTAGIGSINKKKKNILPELSFKKAGEKLTSQPVLLLFGTGQGLAPEAVDLCDAFLPPLRWHGGYNHLSVRSAVAIILDRILGDWY